MKNCIMALFILPMFSLAQDCSLKKSTDPFTHETKLSTGFNPFTKSKISVDASPSLIDIFIWVTGDQRCYDDQSTVEVIFEGEKTKWKFKNTGTMNCDGAFHFSFKNYTTTNSQLNKIATKKLAQIKLVGSDKAETVIIFNEDQKTALMNMVSCVVNKGKTLIPPQQ